MTEEKNNWIYGDMNSYIFDWLVAKPVRRPLAAPADTNDDEKRINTLIAMLSKESGGKVVPFKSRKK